jgi:hypothetical protein
MIAHSKTVSVQWLHILGKQDKSMERLLCHTGGGRRGRRGRGRGRGKRGIKRGKIR